METKPTITLEQFDVATIYRMERERWIKDEAPKPAPFDYLGTIIPYFIIMVAIGAYVLSAPHTAAVLDKLTPGSGWIAPAFVELAIVFIAFRNKQLELAGRSLSGAMRLLLVLSFVTAIITNFTGALVSVVSSAGLDGKSGGEILNGLGMLPVTSQAALTMVVLMAFIVPIVAEVAGHEIAELIYSERRVDPRDVHWRKVESAMVYRAVFTELQQTGMDVSQARDTAKTLVAGYLGKTTPRLVSSGPSHETVEVRQIETSVSRETSQTDRALQLMAEHPEYTAMPMRELEEMTGISRATWSRAKKRLQ